MERIEDLHFQGERLYVIPSLSFREYMTHPVIRRLYLTDAGFFPKAAGHYRDRREGIEEYILLCCIDGQGTIESKERSIRLHSGEALCIPKDTVHRYYADEAAPWSLLWLHFSGEDVRLYPLEEWKVIGFAEKEKSLERLMYLFTSLFELLEEPYTKGNFICISQLLGTILSEIYFREAGEAAGRHQRQVTEIVRFMERNLKKELTLSSLADRFLLSKSQLNSIFHECTGTSPVSFLISMRLKKACRLLRSTDIPIGTIAAELGYEDQYYFSRLFRKTVGCSPSEYRKGDVAGAQKSSW